MEGIWYGEVLGDTALLARTRWHASKDRLEDSSICRGFHCNSAVAAIARFD